MTFSPVRQPVYFRFATPSRDIVANTRQPETDLGEDEISTVLVVDDEPDIVTYLTTILEDNGYRTRSAGDADSALSAIRARPPDLICIDIMMPRRSGLSLYHQVKTDPDFKDIPVIVISAFSRLEDFTGQKFRRLFPDESVPEPSFFIEKPVNVEHFLETVEQILSGGSGQ
jgi:two-component system phosphate regulon response regulator PhoB